MRNLLDRRWFLVSIFVLYLVRAGGQLALADVDFEDLVLPSSDSAAAEVFTSGGAAFFGQTRFDCCWEGWVYSNSALNQDLGLDPGGLFPTNPQFLAQTSTAYLPPNGANTTYAIAVIIDPAVDPVTRMTAPQIPIVLPAGEMVTSVDIANTTWAANNVVNGDAFGGPFGPNDQFTVTIIGESSGLEIGSVDIVLADGMDLLDNWTTVSLVSLSGADTLLFALASTDTSNFGGGTEFLNTPTFFAIDNLLTRPIPEPVAFAMAMAGILCWGVCRRREIQV